MASPSTDPLTALLEETLVEGFVKAKRAERILAPVEAWSCDLREGLLRLGEHPFRVDVLGTESYNNDTFVSGWTNPSFEDRHVRSSDLLRRYGAMHGIPELTDDEEISIDRLNGDVIGVIAVALLTGCEAHHVAMHDEGAIAFALHGPPLHDAPLTASDLAFALNAVATFAYPFDHRRAIDAFAGAPLPGITATAVSNTVTFAAAGAAVVVSFDAHGRIEGVESALPGVIRPIGTGDEVAEAEPDDDETVDLGRLALDGDVVLCDPYAIVDPRQAEHVTGLPAGEHDVAVWLVADPEGGRRVQVAYLFFTGEDDEDDDVVDWQMAWIATCDSGVLCLAEPQAAQRLLDDRDAVLAEIEAALEANATDTWSYAALDGIVAFSTGYGTGLCEVSLGFDAGRRLVNLTIDCLPPYEVERDPELPPLASGSPGRGLQRVWGLPAWLGGGVDPRNVYVLPARTARAITRRLVDLLADGLDGEVQLTWRPEYEGESMVPSRVHLTGSTVRGPFDEVVEVDGR